MDSIRREEFGLDNDEALGEAGRKLRTVQNDRMGRALQRLSRELYSTDSHFVLELVQNSDDNIYTDGVEPSLTFSLFPDKILVHNNEVGFSERNLRALCDVGKSTKASIQGFIGCKGIGWKSVFRVTDRPEIYSNGFRVKFDLESDRSLGFVLPTWINEDLPGPSPPDCTTTGGGTLTVLPLKDPALASGLALKLNDIRPTLLLFLRRLHHITIKLVTPEQNSDSTSPPSPRTMVMSKSTLPRPPGLPSQASIVQLVTSSHSPLASCDTGGCERWLVVKSIIQTKVRHIRHTTNK